MKIWGLLAAFLIVLGCGSPPPQSAMDCALLRYDTPPDEIRSLGYTPQASARLLCSNGSFYQARFDEERIAPSDVPHSELPARTWVRAVIYEPEGSATPAVSLFATDLGTTFRGRVEGPLGTLDAESLQNVTLRDSRFLNQDWEEIQGHLNRGDDKRIPAP